MADTRPRTCRSNVGCEAIEEPCTKRMVPSGGGDVPAVFSHRKSRTGPFVVQCSRPVTAGSATIFVVISFPPSGRHVVLPLPPPVPLPHHRLDERLGIFIDDHALV